MPYAIHTETRPAGGKDQTVVILSDTRGTVRAELWPGSGFNCLRWQISGPGGFQDLLYAAPDWEQNPVPTRSGIPILFPFPNRIRAGKYAWAGREYQLPTIDSTRKNAIHGWACRNAWRVVDQGFDGASAWVTGTFQPSVDAPDVRPLWPADYRLTVTYRLMREALRIETRVENPDTVELPFGLGFHPYFRLPRTPEAIDDYTLHVPAGAQWLLEESLPTGQRVTVPAQLNFNTERPLGGLSLDTLYTALPLDTDTPQGLHYLGQVRHPPTGQVLSVWAAPAFRELLVFTPPHRRAVCLEPYTCVTDAINLQSHGVDAGWLSLVPGASWSADVELRWHYFLSF